MTSEIRVNKLQNRVGLGTVEYTNTGIVVSGIVTCTELSGLTALNIAGVGTASTLDINGDIDVDGHTNLDNVSVAGVSTFSDHINLPDNKQIKFGDSADFKLEHNTNENYIDSNSGHIYIRANVNDDEGDNIYIQAKSGENSIICNDDGDVQLYYDGGIVAQTTQYGFQITNGALDLNNTGGSGASIRCQSVGPFYVGAAAQGDLILYCQDNTNNSVILQANTGEKYVECNMGGSVDLYHHGNKRLETSSVGVSIPQDLDVGGHTNLDNVSVAGVVTVTTNTQYKGFNLGNGSNLVAELVGLDSDNDNGVLGLWDGGVKKTFLAATGYSWFMGGNVGINTTTPSQKLVSYADSGYPFVANGPSNSIALNNAGVIVFGTKDVASYASGSFDATDYTFKSSGNIRFTMSSSGQFVLASGGIDFNTPGTGTFYNPGLSDATGFNFLSNQIVAYTANTPRLYINSNGAIGIGQASPQANAKLQVNGNVGSSGYFYTTSTSSPQTDFTSSQASNKAGLLLHRLSETDGDYCGMEFHTHPSSITTYRKGGIYYQANGTGFGRGDIVFVNDNAGDSGNLALSDHKFRIKNDGSLRAFTASNAVSCFSNYDHGNVDFNHRGGRVLTSNAYGWDGNASSDGADPILVLAVENRAGNSDIGDAYGLALHSESQDDNDYGPLIGWTNRSNSGNYNTTYAAIVGKKTGQATDSNWSAGELHFHTNKPQGFYADPSTTFPSLNYPGYMNENPDLKITSKGYVVTHRNPAFAAHGAGSWTNITNGKFDFNGLSNNYGGDFGIRNDNYSTSNARFTAPVTGIYHFSVNIYTNSTTLTEIKSIVPRINGSEVHNGNDTVFFCGIRQNANALADGNTISGSLTLRLVKDDYIEVWARANITQQWAYYKGHSSWTGHLVG